jgi:hypothetical protein
LYKSARFSIPNIPLTAVPGTQLLSSQSSALVDSSGNNLIYLREVTINGSLSISTDVPGTITPPPTTPPPTTPASIVNYSTFHNSGGYFTPLDQAFVFGTGDWTFECYFKVTKYDIFHILRFNQDGDNLLLDPLNNGTDFILKYSGGQVVENPTIVVKLNSWYHIACVRYNGTVSIYINSLLYASTTVSKNTTGDRSAHIGTSISMISTDNTTTGYFSNVRIVKGTALYTKLGFAFPSLPLQKVAGTVLLSSQSETLRDNSDNNFSLSLNPSRSVTVSTEVPVVSSITLPPITPTPPPTTPPPTTPPPPRKAYITSNKTGRQWYADSDISRSISTPSTSSNTVNNQFYIEDAKNGGFHIKTWKGHRVYVYCGFIANRLEADGAADDGTNYYNESVFQQENNGQIYQYNNYGSFVYSSGTGIGDNLGTTWCTSSSNTSDQYWTINYI